MLELVKDAAGIRRAQRQLERELKRRLKHQGQKRIGFPGGNSEHSLYSNGPGQLFFAPAPPNPANKTPRFWNSFGFYAPDEGMQSLTVNTLEVYEVKTSADRHSLYTAIGQLVTHAQPGTKRILVIPRRPSIPSDVAQAIAALNIAIQSYDVRWVRDEPVITLR